MNHISWCSRTSEWYVTAVRRDGESGYVARGKRISFDGRLLQLCQGFLFGTLREAEDKARDLARTKRRRGYEEIPEVVVPDLVKRHFEADAEMQVTVEELMAVLEEAKTEVYLVLKDVSGLEPWFDAGVEYMGACEGDEYVGAHDRFGEVRVVSRSRLDAMRPTERAAEAFETARRLGR